MATMVLHRQLHAHDFRDAREFEALVRAVAERHGAKLEMSPVAPHGLRITLNFANL